MFDQSCISSTFTYDNTLPNRFMDHDILAKLRSLLDRRKQVRAMESAQGWALVLDLGTYKREGILLLCQGWGEAPQAFLTVSGTEYLAIVALTKALKELPHLW